MPVRVKIHMGHPRGHDPGHSWQHALRGNGVKPTIFPHVKHHGPITGHPSKADPFGRWSGAYKGRHR